MNRRPGHVDVTTEVGYCNFCQRPRNLRTEAHHLGTLVRTIVTCETCHRTLSSTMGVATAPEAPPAEPVKVEEPAAEKAARPKRATAAKTAVKTTAAKKKPAAANKPAAKKPAATKKAAPAKPRSTATRKTTRTK
ncbi:MAG TPA: hypothetical protein VKE27_06475 [Candidatus Dormibacteraeota bacterium]|nr:hypothetical protein [Candidatus Dormibacteraeota bacterium]